MPDVQIAWQLPATGGPVTNYQIAWTLNGAAAGVTVVPQSAAGDAGGYTSNYSTANPTPLNPGDVVSATIEAVNAAGDSPVVTPTPATVTVPTPPPALPGAPANVTLTYIS